MGSVSILKVDRIRRRALIFYGSTSALITVLLGVLTVSLFLYVLLVPLIHGIRPDVCILLLLVSYVLIPRR